MCDIEKTLEEAQDLLGKEKYDQAEKKFKTVLKEDAVNVDALFGMGIICYDQDKLQEAINYFDSILKIEPDYYEAKVNLAKTYGKDNQVNKCIELLEEISPGSLDEDKSKEIDRMLGLGYAEQIIDNWSVYTIEGSDGEFRKPTTDKEAEYGKLILKKLNALTYITEETEEDIDEFDFLIKEFYNNSNEGEKKMSSDSKVDTSKIDDYFSDAPTDVEPETEGWSEVDQKAHDLLEQAFQVWTVVETDEENEIEYRKPTKKKQIEESQILIDEAKALNSDNEWIKNRIVELQEVVDSGKKKVFDGSYKLMIASVILAFFMFVLPGLKSCSRVGDITLLQATNSRQSRITSYNSSLERANERIIQLEKGEEANPGLTKSQIKDELKSKKKSIKNYNKELKKYNDMSDKKMLKKMKASRRNAGWKHFWRGIFYLICVALYYFVCFTPQFVFDKRQAERNIIAGTTNFLSSIWSVFTNALINTPNTSTRYRYSDGSTRTESDLNVAPLIGLALKIGGPIIWYIFNMFLLPIIVIVKYVRNHHLHI